jgi:hypothetical protein
LQQVYWGEKGIWAKGYFVSTVGINEKIIQEYFQMQEEEDTGLVDKHIFHFKSTTACKGVGV